MKKITFLLTMLLMVATSWLGSSQTVDIGSGTDTNGTSAAAPINIYYESMHYQVVYTEAELTAAGAVSGNDFSEIGWYVTGAPANNLPNYSIKMKHTTAADASTYDGSGLTSVLSISSYAPTDGGYDMTAFDTNFNWNGTDNILLDICFEPTSWNSSGQLRTFSGTSRYVRDDGSNQCGVSTDTDLTYRPQVRLIMVAPPACAVATGLNATNVALDSADLNWTAASGAVDYNWEVQPQGTAQGTAGAVASGTGVAGTMVNTGTVLVANTSYDFFIQTNCGGGSTSDWAGPVTFTTLCPVYTPDYTELFDTFVPGCWDEADSGDAASGPGGIGASPWSASTIFGNDVKINLYTTSRSDWILSPEFDLSVGGYEVKLDVAVTDWNSGDADTMGSDDKVELLYTEDGTNWTSIGSWTVADNLTNALTTYSFVLSSTAANVQFGILATDGPTDDSEDYDFHVDNFVIDDAPSCVEPTTLNTTNIAATSADLNWTAATGAVDYNWEVQPQGIAQGTAGALASGTGIVGTTVNTGTTLSENTSYDFFVQTNCGGGSESTWAGPRTFTTLCATKTLPWTEDFENAGTIPSCWSESGGESWLFSDSGSGHLGNAGTMNGATGSGNYFAWIDDSGDDSPSTLTSPFVDVSTLGTPMLSFFEISDNEGNSNATLDVEIWDGANWTNVGSYNSNTVSGWVLREIELSAIVFTGDAAVRFIVTDSGEWYDDIAIDDVTFVEAPSCLVPTGLSATNKIADAADLGWTDTNVVAPNDGWEYEIVDVTAGGAVTGSGLTTTTNPVHVTGLTVDNEYKFLVRALCDSAGGDLSDWSVEYAWTQTEVPGCASNPSPVDGASDVAQGTVTFTWDAPTTGGTATSYDLYAGNTNALEYGLIGNYATPTADLNINGFNTLLYWQIVPKNAGGDADAGCPIWSFTTVGPHTDSCAGYSSDPDPDLDIPDNNATGLSDTITVAGTGPDVLDDLDVIIYADHTYLGDLEVTLTSPTGTSVVLFANHCGENDTMDIIFDDEATALVCGTPTSGAYAPSNPLSAFSGETFDGDWVLNIVDSAGGDTGTLNKWCLVPILVSCPTPTTLTATNETSTGADLAWNEVGSATVWDIEIGVQGFVPTGTPTNDNVGNPYTWAAGAETTSYDYYVRADCAGDDSDVSSWAGPFTFTTLANCLEPTALTATNITTTSADLGWTENNDPVATQWNIEWGAGGFAQGSGTMITGTTTNPHALSGLTGKSTYDFYVQTDCGGGSTSPWAGPFTFVTPGTCGTYSVSIEDTYGDGWNGAEIDIYVNGVLEVADFTLANGNGPVAVDLPVDIDDIISIDYTAGDYSTENEYFINDDTGTAVLTEGAGGVTPSDTGDYTIPTGYITCDSCPDPSELTVSNETSTGADVTWVVNGTETTWDLYFAVVGDPAPVAGTTPTVDDTTDNPYTWTGGLEETDYNVWVRSSCDTDDWVGATAFTTLPFCTTPTGTATTNITITTADLSWTDTSVGPGRVDIVYGIPGFDPDTEGTTVSGIAANPYTLDPPLTANTDYEWYVRSWCDDAGTIVYSDWSSVNAFTTLCDVVTAFPYLESFEAPFAFDCWGNVGTSSYFWETNDGSSHGPGSVTDGTQAIMFNVYNASRGNTATATTPTFDLTALVNPKLSFDFWMDGSADADLWLRVEQSTDGGANWSQIFYQEQDGTISAWTSEELTISGYTATTQFRFIGSSDYGSYNTFVDNFVLQEGPTDTCDWYNLQHPGSGTIEVGFGYDVYARVYEPGVTDSAGQGPGIDVWIGYGATGTNPDTWTDWVVATYNADDGANNDEYIAEIGTGITVTGNYDYASRFQLNGGPFTYGGFDAGTGSADGAWDGTDDISGALTVTDATLDWNNLDNPTSATITFGDSQVVEGQAYKPTITDAVGQGANVEVWVGYSTTDTDPSTWTDWIVASYTVDDVNNDVYAADLGAAIPFPGTYYYATRFRLNNSVYTYGGTGGVWNSDNGVLTVNPVPGDMLCSALPIVVNDIPLVGNNSNTTAEANEPNGSCWSGTSTMNSIWYSFVSPASGDVVVSTDFDTALDDTHIAIYSITDCADMTTLTEVGCDEDGGSTGNSWNSIAALTGLTGGATYYIQVDGYNNQVGEFNIEVLSQCTGLTTTWDGVAWDNGAPDVTMPAVLDGDYLGEPPFSACTVTITANGTLYISAGETYIAVNDFVNDGEVLIEDTGSFLQTSPEATVSGGGIFTTERNTTAYAEYDYTYFSSPTTSATVASFTNAGTDSNYIWELNTSVYNDADGDTYDDDGQGTEWDHKSGVLTPGVGYAVMGGQADIPFDPNDIDPGQVFQDAISFDGAFNSGDVYVNLVADADATDGFTNQNLIGNPYPSAIDIDLFYAANSGVVTPTFYYWTHNTQLAPVAGVGYVFTNDDYAVWTVGTGGAASGGTLGASQYVGSCQGFLANAENPGIVQFSNLMRVVGDNNHFMSPTTQSDDRVWLNMRGNGDFRQVLVGFFDGAADGFDAYYDGPRMENGSNTDFYTVIDGDARHFAIQGANTFNTSKVIKLGLEIVEAGEYSIEIDHAEGVFDEGQTIFIYDTYTNTFHNLTNGVFTFTTAVGEAINDRYEIRFTDDTTGIDDDMLNFVAVYPNPSQDIFTISWRGEANASVQVFDLSGKLIISQTDIESTDRTYQVDMSNFETGVYFMKLRVNDREIVKKMVLQ